MGSNAFWPGWVGEGELSNGGVVYGVCAFTVFFEVWLQLHLVDKEFCFLILFKTLLKLLYHMGFWGFGEIGRAHV